MYVAFVVPGMRLALYFVNMYLTPHPALPAGSEAPSEQEPEDEDRGFHWQPNQHHREGGGCGHCGYCHVTTYNVCNTNNNTHGLEPISIQT